jgi:D-beta-D-heptose 7-phosphate kinase/D-beta-D-heptose 1-phosphate adenosyltransferase
VALNLKALGANVETIGWFGNDERGDELFDILGRRNIGVDQEFRFSTAPTISKSRVTASNQQICRVDREASTECYSPDLNLLGKDITEKVKLADAVIISDYGKGFVTNQLLKLVSVNAKFLAIDPKPSRLLQYAKPDLITPNRFEALELAGLSRESIDPFPQENVVVKIFEQFAPTMLAVTLGADGMLLAEDGEIDKIIPTSAQEVFDVSGAGDTVIAALTLGLVAGKDFQNAAEFANLAAGVVVGKVGTATVSPEEILSLVD